MTTVPSAITATEGRKACCRNGFAVLTGVLLTLVGADHVRPPSVDIENATSSNWKLLKRASCHTAYSVPLSESTATSKRDAPSRMARCKSGVTVPSGKSLLVRIGGPAGCHVTPLSTERFSDRLKGPGPALLRAPRISSKKATRVPSGATTSWLPMVCEIAPGSYSTRAGSQCSPPSVLRENIAAPLNERSPGTRSGLMMLPVDDFRRSHTA